ncbi:MAG: hypothetical protein SFV18_12370 [Bryobacteraceae bacterium]|nr:hypothetical protein [Bryobacteraceae bacterium]
MPELDGRHLSEEQLVWHYYGEEDSASVDLHLEVCRECRASFESLKVSMKAIETFAEPARSADYGAEVWRALVKRHAPIAARAPWWRRTLASPSKFGWAASMAALVLAAFFGGRLIERQSPEVAAMPPAVRERMLADALRDHLERSERVLLEVQNLATPAGLTQSRPRAEELLAANRLYRATAERQGQESLAGLLDDLERVLLDVAHAPDDPSEGDVRSLRARVDDQELLFKVRVLESRLRQTNSGRKS